MHDNQKYAQEREPPPKSALKNAVINAAAFSELASHKNSGNLSQFSQKNIFQQRNNDISSEKKTAGLERKQSRLEFRNTELRAENKAVKQELYAQIKKEYGSIENYAKEKKKPNFQKSAEHTALSLKCAESDKAVLKSDSKISRVSEKSK